MEEIKTKIENWFRELQDQICTGLEAMDGKAKFSEDLWERQEGGGGRSRVITNGNVIEKGGVMFSAVYGPTPDKILKALNLPLSDFFATGVSIVLHPANPWVPIIHMNTRYFEMSEGNKWFGGGIDLTPHYIIPEDAKYFHGQLKEVCDRYNSTYYSKFKAWADDYFYIQHRNETRGIGGIFFDRLSGSDEEFNSHFEFVKDVGKAFTPIYTELANRNRNKSYSESEKFWQRLRRGRYVEFNLVYDKGTKFGLDTGGRIESILMSLPPLAGWEYNYEPPKGSKESDTLEMLKKGINWA